MGSEIRLGGDSDATAFKRPVPELLGGKVSKGEGLARSLFDKGFAALALLFFAPFFLVISLVILITEGGPVFFKHNRIGRNGKTFGCLKFRTMALDADQQLADLLARDPVAKCEWETSQKLENDPRITCIGEFFRKTSLDELPQFWNVLKGDMAVVGPRPIVEDEAHHYGSDFPTYLSVKPGITGLWQVSGRSLTTYEQRVAMDVEYVRNRTFVKDLLIILRTVRMMAVGEGAR